MPPAPIEGTLFHFTRSLENLTSILETDFRSTYCLEETGLWQDDSRAFTPWAVPMVCFCDLRLSQIQDHINLYGGYGIGLTKEWGQRKGLSPVIYLHRRSLVARHFQDILVSLYEQSELQLPPDSNRMRAVMEFQSFFKLYEGKMTREDRQFTRRFYDEREWRYIPTPKQMGIDNGVPSRLNRAAYEDRAIRQHANEAIAESGRLTFEPRDICYIFVAHENEILPMLEVVHRCKVKFGQDEVLKLGTRIGTSSRIPLDY